MKISKSALLASFLFTLLVGEFAFNQVQAEVSSNSSEIKKSEIFSYSEADDCTCDLAPCICYRRLYLVVLTNRIFEHWNPPKSHNTKIVVEFKLHLNGDISNLRVVTGTDEVCNESALKAVKTSAPFYALPNNASKDVDLRFEFPSKKEVSIPIKSSRISTLDETVKIYSYFLQKTLRKSWSSSNCNLGYGKAIVGIDLNQDGRLNNCLIVKKSKSISFDNIVTKMAENLSPVGIAPGLKEKLRCEFTFDSDLNKCYLSKVTAY